MSGQAVKEAPQEEGEVKDGEEDATKTNEVTRRTNTGPLRRRLGAAVK